MSYDPTLPSIFRDRGNNLKEFDQDSHYLHPTAASSVALGTAAVGGATLAAVTGYRWVLDAFKVMTASVVSATLEGTVVVNATVYAGTTAMMSLVLPGNGSVDFNRVMSGVSIATASGETLSIRTATVTPGSVSVNLYGHLVKAADV